MKVVALVSGGKDSCYAMQRCIDYGHEIIALANLLPADDDVDELDSFMFQTVGHQVVGAIAQCMGLPLFRRRIQGTARLQELRYKKTTGDEVEDLVELLLAVKKKFPDFGGVCSGAIASDYQRLRVESICSRLGLVSLAYLWKQDQAALLQNMIDSGIHAILVKVAAIGMDPYKHLGMDLASVQPHLTRLASLYGSNVCGEGGEYESLTLDSRLFKHARIVLDDFVVTLHSPDQIAPVGVLHPTKFHLEAKDSSAKLSLDSSSLVFEVADNVDEEEGKVMSDGKPLVTELLNAGANEEVQITVLSQEHGIVTLGCWRQSREKRDVRDELGLLLETVEKSLQTKGLTWGNVVYVRLLLEDMAFFGSVNEVYVKHITEQKCPRGVPSRCCMQVCLQEALMGKVLLEVTAATDLSKQVLHVQSISCWAPCCIGPYSQATLYGRILHMAGQLGLDPPTMTLVQGGATFEMKQALDNCEAVAGAFNASLRGDAVAITIYCSAALSVEEQSQVEQRLDAFFVEADEDSDDNDTLRTCSRCMTTGPRISDALILFVFVPALPKGAKVEVEPSLFVGPTVNIESDWETSSSSSWRHVHVEPPTISSRPKEVALHRELTKTLRLVCSPGEGLILQSQYCRVLVCIGATSAESFEFINSKDADIVQVEENELWERSAQAIGTLKLFLEQAGLSRSEVTAVRIYYDAKVVAAALLLAAITEAIQDVWGDLEPGVAPTFVPVSGVSQRLGTRKFVIIDLTAGNAHTQP